MFIPEITTRVSTKVHHESIDNAIEKLESDPVLSKCNNLKQLLQEKKEKLVSLEEPVSDAVALRLQSNQERIIASKHYIMGLMAGSVDIMVDGRDRLVGNTASSVDGFPYPLAIEKGTTSHWIAPVTFDALHWTDSNGEHFSKGHMVSGIQADPFVRPSIDDTLLDVEEIVMSQIKKGV